MNLIPFKKHDVSFRGYIEDSILAMKTKQILFRGKPYTGNAIANWNKFLRLWTLFETYSKTNYVVSKIDTKTFESFQAFCDNQQYSDSTKCLYSALLIATLNRAMSDGVTSINIHKFEKFKTKPDTNYSKQVYLREEELRQIELLDLQNSQIDNKVRDIFLIGCYSGQRFSDYSQITANDISYINIGRMSYPVIKIRQKKTGNEVLIPVLFQKAIDIFYKWGGRLPSVSLSTFDRHIKKICKMAGIEDKVLIERKAGGRAIKSYIPKYKLITSHTARRTCITLLHLDGRLTSNQIRSISGHKTEAAFDRYLCQSKEDEARSIIRTLELKPQENYVTLGNLLGNRAGYQSNRNCH